MEPQDAWALIFITAITALMTLQQWRWRGYRSSRAWRMPAVLCLLGIVLIGREMNAVPVGAGELSLVAAELIVGAGIGIAIGTVAALRRPGATSSKLFGRTRTVDYDSRNGPIGMTLWIGYIVARIALGFWAQTWDSHLIRSAGVALIALGICRLARAVTISRRAQVFTLA